MEVEVCVAGDMCGRGLYIAGGYTWQRGTEEDGTHPTGMQCC